jgi:hypothetical protein
MGKAGTNSVPCRSLRKENVMPIREAIPAPSTDTPGGTTTPATGVRDRTQEKPPLTPAKNPHDSKNPQDPPLDPALLPIGDPAGAA